MKQNTIHLGLGEIVAIPTKEGFSEGSAAVIFKTTKRPMSVGDSFTVGTMDHTEPDLVLSFDNIKSVNVLIKVLEETRSLMLGGRVI